MAQAKVWIFVFLSWAVYNSSANPISEEDDDMGDIVEVEGDPVPVTPVKYMEDDKEGTKLMDGRSLLERSKVLCNVDLDAEVKEREKAMQGRNAMTAEKFLWKNKKMDVYMDPRAKYSKQQREVLEKMLGKLQDAFGDCFTISLYPAGIKPRGSDFVEVRKPLIPICDSTIGRKGPGSQTVHLAYGCFYSPNTVVHEFMHALGLAHEHTRTDRDDYINIRWENVDEDYKTNFNKVDKRLYGTYDTKYDYNSLMHYDSNDFSTDRSKPTIVAKNNPEQKLGSLFRNGNIPETDRIKLRRMYKCGD